MKPLELLKGLWTVTELLARCYLQVIRNIIIIIIIIINIIYLINWIYIQINFINWNLGMFPRNKNTTSNGTYPHHFHFTKLLFAKRQLII